MANNVVTLRLIPSFGRAKGSCFVFIETNSDFSVSTIDSSSSAKIFTSLKFTNLKLNYTNGRFSVRTVWKTKRFYGINRNLNTVDFFQLDTHTISESTDFNNDITCSRSNFFPRSFFNGFNISRWIRILINMSFNRWIDSCFCLILFFNYASVEVFCWLNTFFFLFLWGIRRIRRLLWKEEKLSVIIYFVNYKNMLAFLLSSK